MRARLSQVVGKDFLSVTMERAELNSKELHTDGALALQASPKANNSDIKRYPSSTYSFINPHN